MILTLEFSEFQLEVLSKEIKFKEIKLFIRKNYFLLNPDCNVHGKLSVKNIFLSSHLKTCMLWIIWRVWSPQHCGELSMTHHQLRFTMCRKFRNDRQLTVSHIHCCACDKWKQTKILWQREYKSWLHICSIVLWDWSWNMKRSFWCLLFCIVVFHYSVALIVSLQ